MTREEFSERVERILPVLYRVCVSQLREPCDREDAVQAALEKGWQNCDRLREGRYFETWLIRILLNECHDLQKRQKRQKGLSGEVISEVSVEDGGNDLQAALCALDNQWRVPILLHYIEGYGVGEIARMLAVPVGTVKTRLSRGRRKLKELLTGEELER